ncbi:hypothetical protein RE432_16340 [Pusillimonas sp. SM2304]|uniref:hypothetical protein n=1 Tax=Pusillimonas sp. SM2304 TaxID=3073241 RepID=UPI002876A3FF|nr:hypothetical protein [Pusillimonas sp. SM2304]MDS1142012.1 hypothetical protein [Pusillimonas sp. SM2304]
MEKLDRLVLLAVGLVGGWLIATFPGWVDAWGKEHWWNIATAFGTVGAAVGAVLIALFNHLSEKRKELAGARRYAKSVVDVLLAAHVELTRVKAQIQAFTPNSCFRNGESTIVEQLTGVLNSIKSIDIERVGVVYPEIANTLSSSKMFLVQAVAIADRLPGTAQACVINVDSARGNLSYSWNVMLQ